MLPAYSLPPDADEVTVMRALVKSNLSHAGVETLSEDILSACETLDRKGGLHAADRKRVGTATGY
jgi:glutamate decarboxylase